MATAQRTAFNPILAAMAHFDSARNTPHAPRPKSALALCDEAEADLRASFAESYGADTLDEVGDWIDAMDLKAKALAAAFDGHPNPCTQAMAEVFEGWLIALTGKSHAGHALSYLAADIRWHLYEAPAAKKEAA